MIIRYRIASNVPPPARTALHVVQTALKVNRTTAQRLIHDGVVSCRGRIVSQTHTAMNVGDQVEIDYVPQPAKASSKKAKAPRTRFEVVHDDAQLIVVNKPAGLLTVPSPRAESNTLQAQVLKWVQRQDRNANAICVHRLDRGVSGLLVFAKDEQVAQELITQFSARKPRRNYAAIVRGNFEQDDGTYESYLTTDERTLNRYSVSDPTKGEKAITHFQVKEHWRDATLLSVRLETGRRNQIRVHFSEAGHAVIGDSRYSRQESGHPQWLWNRLALHAESLGFAHPESGEQLIFTAPWPEEFRTFRRKVHRPGKQRQ